MTEAQIRKIVREEINKPNKRIREIIVEVECCNDLMVKAAVIADAIIAQRTPLIRRNSLIGEQGPEAIMPLCRRPSLISRIRRWFAL